MSKMYFIYFVLLILSIVFFYFLFFIRTENKKFKEDSIQVTIAGKKINAEIANTNAKRAKGLMFREFLGEDEGMLFIFPTESMQVFWMANTKIPLDIIWINKNNKIVHLSKNTPPCTQTGTIKSLCSTYKPNEKAKYVLEVLGGFSDKYGLAVGDEVSF